MRKNSGVLIAIAILMFSTSAVGQELPRLSPSASVTQTIGLTEVKLTYGSPAIRGRVIWGNLVPYDEVWRTGANEATTISFSDDVKINGNRLGAGKYGLFTVPGKKEWTVIMNGEPDQWGAFDYDENKDVLRFKVKPEKSRQSRERMWFSISDVTDSTAEVNLSWEKLRVPFTITVTTQTTHARAIANIRTALANLDDDDWATLNRCASYLIQNNIMLEEAAEWLDKSISIQETFWNLREKAQLSAKMGKKSDAVEIALKAIDIGKASNSPPPQDVVTQLEKMISDWRSSL